MNFLGQLVILAKNVIYMSSCPLEFERRIDFVARKVTLQTDKKLKIICCFLDPAIKKMWQNEV